MASTQRVESEAGESYTKMVGDVEAIGAHCQMAYCNQLDFLPFRCESCRGTFCLDHRSETAHKCPKEGAWAAARRQASLGPTNTTSYTSSNSLKAERTCASPTCSTKVNTALSPGVQCSKCNRLYCLKHRMGEEHDCSNLIPLGARPVQSTSLQTEKAKAAFSRLKAWGREKQAAVTPKPKPSSKAAQFAAVAMLKKAAKGDEKIPTEKRVYLHVEAEAASTTSKFPRGEFFYNKEWSVGRVLDAAAKSLQVQNVNNRGGGEVEKLRVFHVEGGRLLEFGEKSGEALVSGNTVVLLRGVGPAVPDLIEM